MRHKRLAVVAVTLPVLIGVLAGQEPRQFAGRSGSLPISASVVATFIVSKDVTATAPGEPRIDPHEVWAGSGNLDLLVLWRGKPGWFMQGDHKSESSGGDGRGHATVHLHEGGVDLDVELDGGKRFATVAGNELDLGEANLVLVDRVGDAQLRPIVVGTRSIGKAIAAPPAGLFTVLGGVPEAVAFLRCADRLPDPGERVGASLEDRMKLVAYMQQALDANCARIAAK